MTLLFDTFKASDSFQVDLERLASEASFSFGFSHIRPLPLLKRLRKSNFGTMESLA
jgi:hypothetical protein